MSTMPTRRWRQPLAQAALAAALATTATESNARDFVSKRGIPDQILADNLERLANYVFTGELDSTEPKVKLSRLLGKEDLGNSKVQIWFCVETLDDEKRQICGNDVRLIRLDTGLWVIQDDKSGNWLLVRD